MTAQPDHRPGHVALSCPCGASLELPPRAAEAAAPLWKKIHDPHMSVFGSSRLRHPSHVSTFEAFVAAANRIEDEHDLGGEG